MSIKTESIGSIPRSAKLQHAQALYDQGEMSAAELEVFYDEAVKDTILNLEAIGSSVLGDGEQRKTHSFATYGVEGNENMAADGLCIPFHDGHIRQLPRLTRGPFRFARFAHETIGRARQYTQKPFKQAIISASALSLLYPVKGIADYPRDEFVADLLAEQEKEIRGCFAQGASKVQLDFTEGRLSVKLDPSGQVLRSFIDINNMLLDRFSPEERQKIGIHTCAGSDHDSTHSADVDYAELLPSLFEIKVGCFYIALACEKDPERVLKIIQQYRKPDQVIFVGVIDVINPQIETAETVCERVLQAARYIPHPYLATTDDCGFSPFCDDTSTSRETAFAKIAARIEGTALAARQLGYA
ncbi:5-methyltetrahydropteroyltriglutamate--homocysteine methyltransferase [Iodobacter fluviatilis]|uniref:5-methyltetrahydropteroyltriglutamate--homocysteine methyltransferase n=1 Tax=Iodobacter fluviatilis TaxID=537 RepID=A0A377Q5Z5_9NEIS|nr:5-methyltetrahydropteroyltriglutamate--homocysteine methyltransferase [Iodobacter fluviatilis]TCU89326.1 5-methyltetrahydropteroyltriglutamate--homocysteine methyltransferase [Iodobacter fluviatilis]STQ90696.1 5-methyltetrahydropteroyltriglutamate--homocysteine methyltransferase [Iodobacter fluviatilis]